VGEAAVAVGPAAPEDDGMAVTSRAPGLVLTENEFAVPLDHARPDGERISVFVREVARPDGRELPFLLYLQGGPGFEAPRPTAPPSGWIERALRDHRVLLLDQRGTGRSTPVGDLAGRSPQEQADHLAHHRADSIVADAEWIRRELDSPPWAVLGQSFGGFCTLHYLSRSPDGLAAAYVTGGLPPIGECGDDFYRETFALVGDRTRRHYERYPEDRDRVRALQDRLAAEDVRLPGGDRLTWRRFRQLGQVLGKSDGSEVLHHRLELPADSPAFRYDVADAFSFARNPLYAAVHEACVADGGATRWAAERVMPDEFREDPTMFTGEHVFPWFFEDCAALAPLREAAELLAHRQWPRLYDEEVLAANDVPVAAAVYADDMYVPSRFSLETARQVRGLRVWLTNEYEHNGLRADGGRVLGRLMDMVAGRV
jgi:pimeloyl-ACP methyl ester carboxylesterase